MQRRANGKTTRLCFNLVIEVLLISRIRMGNHTATRLASFNLVIEVLLISRRSLSIPQKRSRRSFNLVIEVLLISRLPRALAPFVIGYISFQSRNRGSFDFKVEVWAICPACGLLSFNLVIEVLLISSGVINPGQVEVTPGVSIS